MGDFNARVGYEGPSWFGVRGEFGVGKMNDIGEHLLSFCAINEL